MDHCELRIEGLLCLAAGGFFFFNLQNTVLGKETAEPGQLKQLGSVVLVTVESALRR
jgi:hypothetical protein